MRRMAAAAVLVLVLAAPVMAEAPTYNGYPVVNVVVNGRTLVPAVPAIVMDGRTLLPLRDVAQALRATIAWNGDTQTATITAPDPDVLQASISFFKAQVSGLQSTNADLVKAAKDRPERLKAADFDRQIYTVWEQQVTEANSVIASHNSALDGKTPESAVLDAARQARRDLQRAIETLGSLTPPADGYLIRVYLAQLLQVFAIQEDEYVSYYETHDAATRANAIRVATEMTSLVTAYTDKLDAVRQQWRQANGV